MTVPLVTCFLLVFYWQRLHRAATTIQAIIRGFLARRQLKKADKAFAKLQKNYRWRLLCIEFTLPQFFCYSDINVLIWLLCHSFNVKVKPANKARHLKNTLGVARLPLRFPPSFICMCLVCFWGPTLQINWFKFVIKNTSFLQFFVFACFSNWFDVFHW